MPGVSVTTTVRSGPASPLRAPSGQFFIVGLTERGLTNKAVEVRGMADVDSLLGARVSYGSAYDQLKCFFDEGGERAYVARVVGPAASVGTLTLTDRNGSPAATLRVDAASAGSWSSGLKVEVRNGSLSNTFRIIATIGTTVVEDINNIANPAEAVQKFSESSFIRVTDLGSATAVPDNIPAVITATSLSSGADDRASVTSTHYTNALALFTKDLGDGAVSIPGQNVTAIWTGITNHCITNNRIGLLAAVSTATINDLLTRAAEIDSEYSGLFAPWVKVPDGAGGVRTISPEGYVAACRSRAHNQNGPWQVPAGQIAVSRSVTDVAVRYTNDEANQLNDGRVSVTRYIANTIRLYGWRSLSRDANNWLYLKDRDMLNYLVVRAEALLEPYVFQPIDQKGQLLSAINGQLVGMMIPIAKANGVYPRLDSTGKVVDEGYQVDTGSSVNTQTSLANNEIRARLQVRVAPTGELISLNIVKVNLSSGMS